MFQYAAGRALSLSRKQVLRLDISGFDNYRFQREFDLERIFNCPIDVAAEKEIRGILKWQFAPIVRQVISRPVMARLPIDLEFAPPATASGARLSPPVGCRR